jgi:hypothetical protein
LILWRYSIVTYLLSTMRQSLSDGESDCMMSSLLEQVLLG